MAGKKGYGAVGALRRRKLEKRGGNWRQKKENGRIEPWGIEAGKLDYLETLRVRNYSEETLESKGRTLDEFIAWGDDRDLKRPEQITKPILENYQRWLWRRQKKNGKPLGVSTQRERLSTLKDYFKWLCKSDRIPSNPASEIELPRPEKRLPEQALSIEQSETLMEQPDVNDPLGVRDRAILETLYSTGMRRGELIKLEMSDYHRDKKIIRIRQGKGKKDRVVPVGERAVKWIETYLQKARPLLEMRTDEKSLFLSGYGEGFNADVLSRKVSRYIEKLELGRPGSCHLLRHTCATHMLENGADIRFIQQLLGHEKLETTAIYTEVNIGKLQEIHERCHPSAQK